MLALVPAAGSGSRLGHARPKQYLPLAGVPLLFHALARLAAHPRIGRVVVVLSPGDAWFDEGAASLPPGKLRVLRCGGDTRAATVRNALRALAPDTDSRTWVLVHDAARPCVGRALLDRLMAAVEHDSVGGIAALPVADTLKRADDGRRIAATVPRQGLWAAQTPQMFRFGLLRQALEAADPATTTDEAAAVEALGYRPLLVEGDPDNLKVTWPRDLALAERALDSAGEDA